MYMSANVKGFKKVCSTVHLRISNHSGSHRLEKYLNLEGFLEKSLKIKSSWKSTGKSLKSLEKFLNSTISVELSTVDRELIQYKIVMPLFEAALCCTKYRHNNFIKIFQD